MRKTKMMLLGVLLATAGASWTATAAGIDQYALKEFTPISPSFTSATPFRRCTSPEYNIKQWQQRTCLRRTPAATGPIWAVTTC